MKLCFSIYNVKTILINMIPYLNFKSYHLILIKVGDNIKFYHNFGLIFIMKLTFSKLRTN